MEIEHGSFSPIVFFPYGGTGREADRFDRTDSEASKEKEQNYSTIIHWLKGKLSFNLLKSAVMCLRGCSYEPG